MPAPGLTVVYLVATVIAAITAVIMWRYRELPGGRPLALMIAAASLWALLDAVELQATTVAGKRFVSQLQYLPIVCVAPLFLRAALDLSRLRHRWRSPTARLASWGVPVLTVAAAWTDGAHGWLWREITIPDPATNLAVYRYGPWFWVNTAHAYLLLAGGTLVLLTTMGRVRRPFRAPIVAVVASVLLAWLGNVAYILKLGPWPGLNWLSVSLVLSGALLAWGALQGGLFDLLPRARELVVGELADAVVVLDRDGRVAFRNRSAEELLDRERDLSDLGVGTFPREPDDDGAGPAEPWQREVAVETGRGTRWLDVRGRPVRDRWGEVSGQLLVFRDVTGRKELEEARERLISDLESALSRVRTLEGMLPICAGCRKVRDDEGYWQRIEEYLGDRMPVVFSHGLCPDCEEELFPEVAGERPEERRS